MKRSRLGEAQTIGFLKRHQAGMSAQLRCRKHGISDATNYDWRRKLRRPTDAEPWARMKDLTSKRPRFGYRRLHNLLKRAGSPAGPAGAAHWQRPISSPAGPGALGNPGKAVIKASGYR